MASFALPQCIINFIGLPLLTVFKMKYHFDTYYCISLCWLFSSQIFQMPAKIKILEMFAALLITALIKVTGTVDYVPYTGPLDQCEYKFTVTTPVDCSITDSDLKNTVRLMKQDIDMTRLSTVSLNSAIQVKIRLYFTSTVELSSRNERP